MSNVAKVEPHPKNPEWRVVTMDDTRQFIVFSAGLADRLEIGKPLPQGTEEQPPKFDGALPSLKLPRPQGGGGMSAWRNTKEGFEAEARGRQRWQEVEEEKRDRRTALMQAVEAVKVFGDWKPTDFIVDVAAEFYAWLRSSSAPGDQEATKAAQGRSQAVPGPSGEESGRALGEGIRATGFGIQASPSSGEASAASAEPGVDDSGEGVPLGSTRFPVKPEDCTHKFGTTGNWLKTVQIDGKPHCPRCGMSALLYRESDVGP